MPSVTAISLLSASILAAGIIAASAIWFSAPRFQVVAPFEPPNARIEMTVPFVFRLDVKTGAISACVLSEKRLPAVDDKNPFDDLLPAPTGKAPALLVSCG